MFEPGDLIIYGSSGVCRVAEISQQETGTAKQSKLYYKLVPVYSTETIYTPVDTGVFMRPVISQTEAEDLVFRIPSIQENVCSNRNLTALRDHYETALQTHECGDLVQIIKSIHSKNVEVVQNGKKLGQVDQQYRKRAEDLLYGELAVALDIPRDDVVSYIEAAATDGEAVQVSAVQ